MDREPKYRVWEVKAKYMTEQVCGLDWTMAGIKWYGPGVGSGWCYLDPKFNWDSDLAGDRPEYVDVLMQYTGLDTMHGKEKQVYEADIIGSMSGVLYEVYWSEKAGQWRCRFWNTDHKGKDDRSLTSTLNNAYMRIKSNIHQNPDLIK